MQCCRTCRFIVEKHLWDGYWLLTRWSLLSAQTGAWDKSSVYLCICKLSIRETAASPLVTNLLEYCLCPNSDGQWWWAFVGTFQRCQRIWFVCFCPSQSGYKQEFFLSTSPTRSLYWLPVLLGVCYKRAEVTSLPSGSDQVWRGCGLRVEGHAGGAQGCFGGKKSS